MSLGDWSSDVCVPILLSLIEGVLETNLNCLCSLLSDFDFFFFFFLGGEIGRALGRVKVWILGVAVSFKKKKLKYYYVHHAIKVKNEVCTSSNTNEQLYTMV